MYTSLTLVVCLSSVAAPPAASNAPGVPFQPVGNSQVAELPHEGTPCQNCGHHTHRKGPLGDWLCPRCDMSQRYPYYPTNHGHYYFRPYHMQRVLEQQGQAISWGEDARNPYGQRVFERVYEQLRREQAAQAETLPEQPPEPKIEVKPEPAKPMPSESPAPAADEEATPPEPLEQKQASRRPFKFSR